ncbi:FAD-dependent oxidoreductase [Micromonospora sp. NPDC005206]|uniref:FAD-dependent oxidoreductase n=1 Tax=Micromonospora sp. NPDC005206 TaxID=3157022 RepID=UPI0033A4229C
MPEYDLICVGGGLGGLAAAARAASSGLRVLVIEASQYLGGGGAYSGGLMWAPGAPDGDPPDSVDAADAYLRYAQGERNSDGDLRREILSSAQEALAFYRSLGIDFEVVPGNPDVYYPDAPGSMPSGRMLECAIEGARLQRLRSHLSPSPHYRAGLRHRELFDSTRTPQQIEALFAERERDDFLTMGIGLAAAFVRAALIQHDVDWVLGHRVQRLVEHSGRVSGVRAVDPGGHESEFFARRGVLLATGGYGWADFAADLEGLPDFVEAGPPSIRGDHLCLAEAAGAAVVRGGGPQFSMGAHLQSGDVHSGTEAPLYSQLFDVMGLPHTMVVNRAGRRFGDESYYVGINSALSRWDPAGRRWENFPCYLLFDEQFRKNYRLGTLPAGAAYPDTIARADTLEALAATVGIDGEALADTVSDFNANADLGIDPVFGRGSKAFVRRRYGDARHQPNPNLGAIAEPPIYALPLRLLGIGVCTFGLQADADARVLRRDGTPVPGLFATGNAVATTEFRGYVTGYANTRNIVMAYRAGCAVSANS